MNEIKLNSKVVATSEYDAIGRQTKLIDINAGTSTYTYTPFGEMKTSTNASGANRTKEYDEFGRLMQENIDGYIINYEYVAEGNGLNQLKKISTADGMEEIYDYDELGRVHTLTENIQGELFMFTYTYNELNQPESITYPSGLVVYNVYDDKGTLIKVTDAQGEIYWEGLEQDAFGRFTSFTKGDGVTTTYKFDDFQQLEEIQAGNIQHHTYQWDNQTGNLNERKDLIYGLQESFTYDNLNRLETGVASSITGGFVLNSISTAYEGNGNIDYKSDAGDYTYHEEKINAVVAATNDIGQISGLMQDITYTSRQKAELISEGGHTLNFVYGHDNHRRKTMYSNQDGVQLEKYFVGPYEKEIEAEGGIVKVRHINYISAGDGMTAIVLQEEVISDVREVEEDKIYFTYKDHLGSIVALTDVEGDVVMEQSFDAWGRYRNPQDWTYNDVEEMPTWLRGYTGHEHLPHFDLINMNGRVYDPILGRMLSPDIYIQDPLFSQSYNRYSYCWNNPLRYTDPSGDVIAAGSVIAAALYVGFNIYSGGVQANDGELKPWKWEANQSTLLGLIGGTVAGVRGLAFAKIASGIGVNPFVAKSFDGVLRVLYNYDPNRGFGWHTVRDFSLGFLSSHIGIEGGLEYGLLAGGMFNAFEGMLNDETPYEIAQRFVGGALITYSAVSLYGRGLPKAKYQYLKYKGNYIFGKSVLGKALNKAVLYTGLSNAAAFAFTPREYYTRMNFGDFAFVSGGGFINGTMQGLGNNEEFLKDNFRNNPANMALAFRYAGLTSDLLMSVRGVTKENPFNYKKFGYKGSMSQIKLLFYNLAAE